MKYLAIDYGTKRVGLAINHESLAEPLEVVEREQALDRIVVLIAQHSIDTLILGISEGQMAEDARAFARDVVEQLPKPVAVIEVDETLTSLETHDRLAKSGMPREKRQGAIDHYAAAAILQDYLDSL